MLVASTATDATAFGRTWRSNRIELGIADDTRALDIFILADRQHGAAHDPRDRRDIGEAERQDEARRVGAEHHHDGQREQNGRKGEERVIDRHDDAVPRR
jgi:hypothetical protein